MIVSSADYVKLSDVDVIVPSLSPSHDYTPVYFSNFKELQIENSLFKLEDKDIVLMELKNPDCTFASGNENIPSAVLANKLEVIGSTFDANGFTRVQGIYLSHPSREDGHSVKIAYNTFRGMQRAVTFTDRGDYLWYREAFDHIAEGSVCNHWIPSEHSKDRCFGSPATGFIHFSDGVICGEAPEGFSVDCPPLPPTPSPSPLLTGVDASTSVPESSKGVFSTTQVPETRTVISSMQSDDSFLPSSALSAYQTTEPTPSTSSPESYRRSLIIIAGTTAGIALSTVAIVTIGFCVFLRSIGKAASEKSSDIPLKVL